MVQRATRAAQAGGCGGAGVDGSNKHGAVTNETNKKSSLIYLISYAA